MPPIVRLTYYVGFGHSFEDIETVKEYVYLAWHSEKPITLQICLKRLKELI
jgi:hypothetical protein